MQSQCRRREIFWPGENKLHHRKARVYETICSRSLISRSFDSGPCEACLVSMRDNVFLLHSWDGRPYFILFRNTTLHRLGSVMLTVGSNNYCQSHGVCPGVCLRQNKGKRKRESKCYRCQLILVLPAENTRSNTTILFKN